MRTTLIHLPPMDDTAVLVYTARTFGTLCSDDAGGGKFNRLMP